ncbi:SulP family inorganic anion transporter [Marinomonas ostreistagni]|uniref:SulP family inorganic anion transporter n=1 Tax=Marinomonas ostreistagni TaxID=359209 RepID=A0ABS0ZGN8_9GAMM|nr:SulP family inorganic anion transporter [Marinomonas ostreistagni]MBJ7552663.1 SulP family inorganic anion transporter [Marinomonas ostreistagni]
MLNFIKNLIGPRSSLKLDFIAGVTGAILVIPQGIAYAIIAGLPPQIGLYTAIFSAILAALFGCSRHMVSGPTAALSIVCAAIVGNLSPAGDEQYLSLMCLLSLLVGGYQLAFWLIKAGNLVNFISHSVVQGFTSGAALVIGFSQVDNFLGLQEDVIRTFHWDSVWVGTVTLLGSILVKRWMPAAPYLLFGMGLGVLACIFLADQNVMMVSALPSVLPSLNFPAISFENIIALASGALSVAILGSIEAVSIARSIATRSKQRIDGNQEIFGQGISNVVGAFFQCYPSSGSFTRSGANFDAGAQSCRSVLFSAGMVFCVLSLVPSITSLIPVPVMAGSILVIAWNLFDWKTVWTMRLNTLQEKVPFILTLVATLVFPLEYSIYVGVIASLLFYLSKTSKPLVTPLAPRVGHEGKRQLKNVERYQLEECPEIKVLRVDGSIFYGSIDAIQGQIERIQSSGYQRIILVLKGVNFIDLSGQHGLAHMLEGYQAAGVIVYLSSLKGNVMDDIKEPELLKLLQSSTLKSSTTIAISDMVKTIETEKCFECPLRVFNECDIRKNKAANESES